MHKDNNTSKELIESLMKVKRLSHKCIKTKDLHPGEYMTLNTIYRLKMIQEEASLGVKTSDIGKCLEMKKPATSKMLNNLEDKGYIKRLSNKKDRRVIYIDLTDSGLELLKYHHLQMEDFTSKIIDKMGKDDMETFISLLNKLSNSIQELIDN